MENDIILTNETEETDLFGDTQKPEKKSGKETKRKNKQNKKKSKTARIILWSLLGVLLLAIIGVSIFAWHVCHKPGMFFTKAGRVTAVETPAVTPLFEIDDYLPTDAPGTTPIPLPVLLPSYSPDAPVGTPDTILPGWPEATAAPEHTEASEATQMPENPAGPEELTGIVNIALFGIDAFEDGSSTSGSMPHTDANMIVAINFDTKEVSLISIARDCLTTVPGHSGFYKFNGIFNVGGGMRDPKAGFALSCRAAEEWIGGVSIPYYYGVDFQAVIDLVDMIGGIDFDVDVRLITLDGQRIEPGRRHLNGQGVMAYMRMRKTDDGRDSSRTARQRKMLIAVFKKLKKEGKLTQIPEILKTLGDNVYTNTNLSQTAALINFADDIDPDSIRSYSIQGTIHMDYDWAFCFIDQNARIALLKEVYGITAEPIGVNSRTYEKYLHENGFKALQYLNTAKKIIGAVHETADPASMSEAQKTAYAVCWKDYSDLLTVYDAADKWMRAHYAGKFTDEERQQWRDCEIVMRELEKRLKESGNALNEAFGKPVRTDWDHSIRDWYGKTSLINDVYVDFR